MTKEEKEALINQRIEAIRKRNEEILRRYEVKTFDILEIPQVLALFTLSTQLNFLRASNSTHCSYNCN